MSRISIVALLSTIVSGMLPAQVTGVRVFMDPPGPYFTLDGQQFTGPVSQTWPIGSKHQLSTYSPQNGGTQKTQFVCKNWETNRGALTPSPCPPITITADPDITVVKGVFDTYYALTLSMTGCPQGSPCPSPATIYINHTAYTQDAEIYLPAGTQVTVEAYPNDGWIFTGWGQLPGNPTGNGFIRTFTLNQPQVLRPLFQAARKLQVNVNTSPSGLTLLMDRTPLATPITLDWGWNTEHTVGTLPAQSDRNGQMMVFDYWSDGGDINHIFKMPAPGTVAVTLTAYFVPGAAVSFLTSPPGLKLTVDGRQNWQSYNFAWPKGSVHNVLAPLQQTDAQGRKYKFVSWSNGGDAVQEITVLAAPDDVRYTATYAPVSEISISSVPSGVKLQIDGADCLTPCTIERDLGVPVRLLAPAIAPVSEASRLVFQGWSDGGPADRKLTSSALPQSLTANFQLQHRLSVAADPDEGVTWRLQPDSPDRYYDAQTQVSLAADTRPGFRFSRWSGDVGGTVRPAMVTMSSPKTVVAVLDRIPFVSPGAVRNAAGETPENLVAPGSVISIVGVNLAPSVESSSGTPLKQILAGVTVWVDERLLPLYSVSPEQINAQLPADLAEGTYTLTIRSEGKPAVKVDFTAARNAPGVFSQTINDQPFAAAAHADGSAVTPDKPARKGEVLTLLGTGFGPYAGTAPDGFAFAELPEFVLVDAVEIVIGDTVTRPSYAGIAAGRVGVNAVRFTVGNDLPGGTNVALKVRVNGHESNTVTLPLE